MIEDALSALDYNEAGTGPAILLVPGSCSTGAAWRPVASHLADRYRIITTSLPGYGGSGERRTDDDHSIEPLAVALETIIERASDVVHLVGHSFGGSVALAVALRRRVRLASLTILEAPAPGMLVTGGQHEQYAAFKTMTDAYIADFQTGNTAAIASMIDFYGGPGTFSSWPPAVRDYATKTTPSNILDWESAYAFQPAASELAEIDIPLLVAVGELSHPSVVMANKLISDAVPHAVFGVIDDASHFMITTHADKVARLIEGNILMSKTNSIPA